MQTVQHEGVVQNNQENSEIEARKQCAISIRLKENNFLYRCESFVS